MHHWKQFPTVYTKNLGFPVLAVAFCPTVAHKLAYAVSARIDMLDLSLAAEAQTEKKEKQLRTPFFDAEEVKGASSDEEQEAGEDAEVGVRSSFKFYDSVTSVAWRSDGQLLAAGTKNGQVRVF